MELEGRLSRESGVVRGSRDGVGIHRVREDAWPSESPLDNPRPRPPVPKSFLRTLSVRSWESCWEVWPVEIARSSGWQGGLPFPRQVPRDPVQMVRQLKGGVSDPRETCGGGA